MSDADDWDNDCPLCLLPLEPYDHSHPLQCPSRHCHFNCCTDCLEQMIKSTKDDQIEASDGNTFRIFLHCPNCRNSHLGVSIRDTLLLRKVDKYSHGTGVIDDRLSASELRFKYALEEDEDIALALEAARLREADFFVRGGEADVVAKSSFEYLDAPTMSWNGNGSVDKPASIWSYDDEEGFEADLLGPHKSFIFRHHSMDIEEAVNESQELGQVRADPTLLAGLHPLMTYQEQQFVTSQLVSGDTARLAAATEMLHYVSALSLQGIKPSWKRRHSCLTRNGSTKRNMLESVREIIQEGNEARRLEEEKETQHAAGVVALHLTPGGRRIMKKQMDLEMKKQMEYMKLHPLPLRMPKYAEVPASRANSAILTFCDDVWDGTVSDAFSKITVKKTLFNKITVTKQHAKSSGIRRVVDAGSPKSVKSNGRGYIDVERPRVIVASISRDLGRQGVVRGDVVSHFNGELFTGTADELSKLIDYSYEGELLTFVFNADSAVAEALKRRSMF